MYLSFHYECPAKLQVSGYTEKDEESKDEESVKMTNMKPHSRRHNFHIIINRSSFQCKYIFFNSCLPVSENTRKIAMNHTTSTKSKISCKRGPTSSTAVIHEL